MPRRGISDTLCAMSWELHNVAIIGGGMMGRSIATKVAQEGINVCLKEVSAEALQESRSELEAALDHEIARFGLTTSEKKAILSRIRWVTRFDCAADSPCSRATRDAFSSTMVDFAWSDRR